jgi:hypothetical protein
MDMAQYNALCRAWRAKQRREQSRFALLATVAAQCAGNKHAKRRDFMDGWEADDE